MNKSSIIIILLVSIFTGGIIGYFYKTNIPNISSQFDLKSSSNNISWITESKSYCDTKYGSCEDFSDTSGGTSSSWGGGSSGGK